MSAPTYGTNVPDRALPKGMAVASLVLGILGIVTSFFLLGGLLGLIAVILGAVALRQIKRGQADGRGMAIGGVVTGVIAVVIVVILIAVAGTFFTNNKEKFANLSDCVQKANGDQAKVQACQDEFARQINP